MYMSGAIRAIQEHFMYVQGISDPTKLKIKDGIHNVPIGTSIFAVTVKDNTVMDLKQRK